MTLVEIVCITLLSILVLGVVLGLAFLRSGVKEELENEKRLEKILNWVEKQMSDDVFPEFKDGDRK